MTKSSHYWIWLWKTNIICNVYFAHVFHHEFLVISIKSCKKFPVAVIWTKLFPKILANFHRSMSFRPQNNIPFKCQFMYFCFSHTLVLSYLWTNLNWIKLVCKTSRSSLSLFAVSYTILFQMVATWIFQIEKDV